MLPRVARAWPNGAARLSGPAAIRRALSVPAIVFLAGAVPATSFACACGCGVFDVGTASMFPTQKGAMTFVEYDYLDQDQNWSGTSRAAAANNTDKRIRTDFMTVGAGYQFSRSWGLSIEVPDWQRSFETADDTGSRGEFTHAAIGDIRIKAIYTGSSDDMSTGITFGLKLPTGDSTYLNFDPDTEIGAGSTDALLGAYHLGDLSADGEWRYFVQVQWDLPIRHRRSYRPGSELDAVAGAYYEGWSLHELVKVAPVLQLSGAYRRHDGGPLGDPVDSGYTRVLVAPGVEIDVKRVSAYVDLGLPLYRNSSGNQLVSSRYWRMNLSYRF